MFLFIWARGLKIIRLLHILSKNFKNARFFYQLFFIALVYSKIVERPVSIFGNENWRKFFYFCIYCHVGILLCYSSPPLKWLNIWFRITTAQLQCWLDLVIFFKSCVADLDPAFLSRIRIDWAEDENFEFTLVLYFSEYSDLNEVPIVPMPIFM